MQSSNLLATSSGAGASTSSTSSFGGLQTSSSTTAGRSASISAPIRQSSIPMANALLSTVNAARQRLPMCHECEKSLPNQIVFDKIESIIRLMQDEQNGLPVKTAKSFMSKIPSVFTGIDLIQWMMKNLKLEDQQESIHLANLIASHGYIFPIEDHTLSIKNDCTFYRFQTPCLWPSNNSDPENTDYAVYLCKRTMQGKTRLELADYEAENLARLQKMFSRKWEFIFMQAESQAKVDKKRDKLERKVLDSQERAFWDVYRPVPGCVNTTELDIKKACRLSKSAKRCSECQKVAVLGTTQTGSSLKSSSVGATTATALKATPTTTSSSSITTAQNLAPSPEVTIVLDSKEEFAQQSVVPMTSKSVKIEVDSETSGKQTDDAYAVEIMPNVVDVDVNNNEQDCAHDGELDDGPRKQLQTKGDNRINNEKSDSTHKSGDQETKQQQQQQQSSESNIHKTSASVGSPDVAKQQQKGFAGHHHHQHGHHHHHHHHHHHPHQHQHAHHHHHHHHRQCPHHKHHQSSTAQKATEPTNKSSESMPISSSSSVNKPNTTNNNNNNSVLPEEADNNNNDNDNSKQSSTIKSKTSTRNMNVNVNVNVNDDSETSESRIACKKTEFMRTPSVGDPAGKSANARRKSECNRMYSMNNEPATIAEIKLGENRQKRNNNNNNFTEINSRKLASTIGNNKNNSFSENRPASACCSYSSLQAGNQKNKIKSTGEQEQQQQQQNEVENSNQSGDKSNQATIEKLRKNSSNIIQDSQMIEQASSEKKIEHDSMPLEGKQHKHHHHHSPLKETQSVCLLAGSTEHHNQISTSSSSSSASKLNNPDIPIGAAAASTPSSTSHHHCHSSSLHHHHHPHQQQQLQASSSSAATSHMSVSATTTQMTNTNQSSPLLLSTSCSIADRKNIGLLERELESLKLRLDKRIGGVKMSKVTQSYLSYFKQWAEYDPFIAQSIPSNPWISDSTELWDSERQTKDVHFRRVRRWAFSLKELLNDPAGREQFHKFLEKEFSAENLKFWDAVQELKRVHSRDVARKVEAIWTEYLAQDANCPINIDSKSYETSKKNMAKNKNNRYIFDEAAGHVYQLMKNDSYPRYLRSDMYKDYKEASEKRRTNQVAFDVFKPQITTLKHKFNF